MKAAFIISFIALCVSMVIAQASTPYYITNPIQGDSFAAGKVLTLQWTNGVGTAKVTLLTGTNAAAMKSAGITFNITGSTGKYDWTVPKTLAQNATWTFEIDYTGTNGVAAVTYSAPFVLTGTTGAVVTQSFVYLSSTAAVPSASSSAAAVSMVSNSSSAIHTPSAAVAIATASTMTTLGASTTPTPSVAVSAAAIAGFKAPTVAVCIVVLIASFFY